MKFKPTTLIIISTIFAALTSRMPANIHDGHAGLAGKHGAGWAEHDQGTCPADKYGGAILKGEDALAALKSSGIYETIRARMEATQYEIKKNPAGGDYHAANPAQDMRACFTEQEAGLAAPTSADHPARTALRLSGIGYGEALQPPGEPKLLISGNRIEYRRATLTEWYINSHDGIEQGFVLESPPGTPRGDDKLALSLEVRGDLRPQMSGDRQSVLLQDSHGKAVLRYSQLKVNDAKGRALPARLALRDAGLLIEVDDRAAAYPVTIDPLITSQIAKLTASDNAGFDFFGSSVSISGDTIVVGSVFSPQAMPNEQGPGAAYIFERNKGGADNWGFVKKLTADDGAADDSFGGSVSISGDALVVGAPGVAPREPYPDLRGTGAAYVFERNAGGAESWGFVKKLTANDRSVGDQFGFSVSISGDTAVVGAPSVGPRSDSGSFHPVGAGAAYVFERNNGGVDNWGQAMKLTANDRAAGDVFGVSVSISGDAAVVGADGVENPDSIAVAVGAAYVFQRNTGGANNWGQKKKLTVPRTGPDAELFGETVSISGDTLVVGAPNAYTVAATPTSPERSGAVYLFERNEAGAENWGQVKELIHDDTSRKFGHSVSLSGDALMVGSFMVGSAGGVAYLFERNTSGADNWGQTGKLAPCEQHDVNGPTEVSVSGDTAVYASILDESVWVFGVNRPPIAACQNVTRSADANCQAAVTPEEVNNGSRDPDGCDPITLSLSPPGPYALGVTTVTLTVADSHGGTDSCTATVTVIDTQAPTVTCSVSQTILSKPWPPKHDLISVGLSATAADNCSGASLPVTVKVFGDEDDQQPTGDGNFSPDAANISSGTLRLRQERKANDDGRVYLIVATAADSSGNVGVNCCTVVVPLTLGKANVDSVNAQAAAAKAYSLSHNGAKPPGYFVIGDGPVIGPKQ